MSRTATEGLVFALRQNSAGRCAQENRCLSFLLSAVDRDSSAVRRFGGGVVFASRDSFGPLNSDVLGALIAHSKWFLKTFGETRSEWYVFPFGKPQPTDPTRPTTTFKTVWAAVKKAAGVKGRWHDNRHTFITDLAESGEASDETIRDMAGHVSKQMLKHYSHIRMEAKRRAVAALVRKAL
jgi:hypothetical protein